MSAQGQGTNAQASTAIPTQLRHTPSHSMSKENGTPKPSTIPGTALNIESMKFMSTLKRKVDEAGMDGVEGTTNGSVEIKGKALINGMNGTMGNGHMSSLQNGSEASAKPATRAQGENKAWLLDQIDRMERTFKEACIAKAHIVRLQADIREQNLQHIYPHTPRALLDRFHRVWGEWRACRRRVEAYLAEADRLEAIRTTERLAQVEAQAAAEERARATFSGFGHSLAASANGISGTEREDEVGMHRMEDADGDGERADGNVKSEKDAQSKDVGAEGKRIADPDGRPRPIPRARAPNPENGSSTPVGAKGNPAGEKDGSRAGEEVHYRGLAPPAALPPAFTLNLPRSRTSSTSAQSASGAIAAATGPEGGVQSTNEEAGGSAVVATTDGMVGPPQINLIQSNPTSGVPTITGSEAENLDFMQYLNSVSNAASPVGIGGTVMGLGNGFAIDTDTSGAGAPGGVPMIPSVGLQSLSGELGLDTFDATDQADASAILDNVAADAINFENMSPGAMMRAIQALTGPGAGEEGDPSGMGVGLPPGLATGVGKSGMETDIMADEMQAELQGRGGTHPADQDLLSLLATFAPNTTELADGTKGIVWPDGNFLDMGAAIGGVGQEMTDEERAARVDRVMAELPPPGDGGLGPAPIIPNPDEGMDVNPGLGLGMNMPADFDISQFSDLLSGFPELAMPDAGGSGGIGIGVGVGGGFDVAGAVNDGTSMGVLADGPDVGLGLMDFTNADGTAGFGMGDGQGGGEGDETGQGEYQMTEEELMRMLAGLPDA